MCSKIVRAWLSTLVALNEAADHLVGELPLLVDQIGSFKGTKQQAPPNVVTEAQRKAADGVFTELRSKI